MAQRCDSKCGYCATAWFKWLKAREANMRRAPTGGVSFADAAASSIKPEDLAGVRRVI